MADEKRHDPFDVESAATRAGFPKSTSFGPNWPRRGAMAEGFLRALVTAVGSFARENGGELPHVLNLPYSVAANHLRVVDDARAPREPSDGEMWEAYAHHLEDWIKAFDWWREETWGEHRGQ